MADEGHTYALVALQDKVGWKWRVEYKRYDVGLYMHMRRPIYNRNPGRLAVFMHNVESLLNVGSSTHMWGGFYVVFSSGVINVDAD